MESTSFEIPVPTSFALKPTALSHGWHECAPLSWSEGGDCLQWIHRVRGKALRVSVVEHARTSRRGALGVIVDGHDHPGDIPTHLTPMVRTMLGVDRDLSEFYALCQEHPFLHELPSLRGGRLLRASSITEDILKTLCATNVNWTMAVKMINRMGQLGPCVPHFRHLNAWPTPREILRAGEKYLSEVCRLGYRTGSILSFCRDACEGRFDPDALEQLATCNDVDSDEILIHLRSIQGIGPSSAHFLLTLLGRYDRLAIDSATVAHVAAIHTDGRKPTRKEIERIYAPYGKWRNLICWCENWIAWETAKQMGRG